jgi:hypothetical protein
MSTTKIKCPGCGCDIDVSTLLHNQVEQEYSKKYQKELAAEKLKMQQELSAVEQKKAELDLMQKQQESEIAQKVKAKLELEAKQIEAQIKARLNEESEKHKRRLESENADRIAGLEKELNEKSDQVKELNKAKAEIERINREKNELREQIEAEAERKISDQLKEEREKIRKNEHEKNELKLKELEMQLDAQKKLTEKAASQLEEMRRVQEQGSMQRQGEVQELALEQLLTTNFPFDTISEVPKGCRGADCIQTVRNGMQQECGSIVFESKRTKNFSGDWIDTLKDNQLRCKAEIAVLVTQAMPAGMDGFGKKDDVWICRFSEVKMLTFILREMLINTHAVTVAQENRGGKMELLYAYMTSNEWLQTFKRIVGNYDSMTKQLNDDKKAAFKSWAEREKQIWATQENLATFIGSIKGIAGKDIDTSDALELPEG